MESNTKSLHPLILIAAVSVTVASLAAAAHFTGLLPTRGSEPAPVAVAAPAAVAVPAPTAQPAPEAAPPAPVAQPAPAAKPEASRPPPRQQQAQRRASEPAHSTDDWRYEGGTRRVSTNDAGIDVIASRPATAKQPLCRECGTVEGVQEIASQGEGTGLGAIAGGVLGGVLGNQVGGGRGKDLATVAGAVGGAYAGHQVEKNVRSSKQYQVSVRFDDGSVRTYTLANATWRTGDRVRLSNGTLTSL